MPFVGVQLLLPAAETTLLASKEQLALSHRHFDDEFATFCDAVLPPGAARKAADVRCVEWSLDTNYGYHSGQRARNWRFSGDWRRQGDGRRQDDWRQQDDGRQCRIQNVLDAHRTLAHRFISALYVELK